MTWQNQPGPQLPWQPGPQFPPQAPAGGYPGQPFQGKPAAPIPPEVFQAAEAAGLGPPTKEYSKGAGSGGGLLSNPGIWIGIIGGGLGLAVGIVVPLLVAPFPFNLVAPVIILLVLLPFAWFFRGLFSGGRGGSLRFWGCPNGLVYIQDRQIRTLRWEQLGLVYRKSALVNGQMAIIGYIVQPVGAPPFEFSVLGGPFGGMANMAAGRAGMSITTGAGTVSNYGGVVQIQGLVDSSAYAGLGELIEGHLVEHQLPLVRETYQRGQTVTFGQLLVQQRGLSDGVNVVTWDEYAQAGIHEIGYIQVYKKPANQIAFQVSGLPNVPVLMAFMKEVREQQKQYG